MFNKATLRAIERGLAPGSRLVVCDACNIVTTDIRASPKHGPWCRPRPLPAYHTGGGVSQAFIDLIAGPVDPAGVAQECVCGIWTKTGRICGAYTRSSHACAPCARMFIARYKTTGITLPAERPRVCHACGHCQVCHVGTHGSASTVDKGVWDKRRQTVRELAA